MATDKKSVNDSGSAGWGVLGFFIPLIGLILFLVWRDTKPKSAKSAGIGALIGVIAYVVFVIIYIVAIAALVGAAATGLNAAIIPMLPLI